MEKFYQLDWGQRRNEVLIEAKNKYDPQALRSGLYTPGQPLVFKISEGKKFYDIVRFQDVFNFAISERLFRIFTTNKLTGWSIYPIIINRSNSNYYGFQVTGKSGEIERPTSSGFVTGFRFDYTSWDGTDLFTPENTMLIFCNEKVSKILIDNKITNLKCTEIEKAEWYST